MCGICVPIGPNHTCSFKLEGECPVCCENLFDALINALQLKCGHWMHVKCYEEFIKHTYKCPLCSKSIGTMDQMTQYIDHMIETTPMPDEYKDKKVDILCNECNVKSEVIFHFYGLKCPECLTYNTKQT
jgi:RING finger/CHY zinc finger protein 1